MTSGPHMHPLRVTEGVLYAFAQLYSWKSDLQDQVSALRMPVLNGIAVARRIRETGTNVVVVFLTAWADLDMLQESWNTVEISAELQRHLKCRPDRMPLPRRSQTG